ncbi:MAG: zinc-binding dehydrogenase [Halobacteriovoraceae bacterium]|nr:zinc-binding dehydrogenase [Halobacteriovoraceae bacterium]
MQILLSNPGKSPKLELKPHHLNSETLGAEEVLIQTAYSGLNFADVMMTMDLYPEAPPAPFCPGYEVSGWVSSVGKDVRHLKIGDKVMGGTRFGGYSDQVVIPAWQVAKLPDHLDLQGGAGLMVSYLTADLCLNDLCRLRPEDSVMIDCGSGALGAIVIEICKKMGVKEVIGLTSKESKLSVIEDRGAKAMTNKEWEESEKMVDIIINSRGGTSFKRDRKKLNPLGRIVGLGASHMTNKGKKSFFKVIREFLSFGLLHPVTLMNENVFVGGLNVLKMFDHPEKMKNSLRRLDGLKLHPVIDKVFENGKARDAIAYLAEGKSKGKILIKWKDSFEGNDVL